MRYGREYWQMRELLAASQWWSLDELRVYQGTELRRLLVEAMQHTQHYREALASLSAADIAEIASTLDLSSIPVLPKRILRTETRRFANSSRRTLTRTATSGSTGSPLVVEYDRASMERRFAFGHRLRTWCGVAPFERSARLSGRQFLPSDADRGKPWVSSPFEGVLLLSTYHLREPHLSRIVERLQRHRPTVVDGYPTAIEQLARYLSARRLVLPSVRMVITTAETLTPDCREAIEAGFGVPLFDYYSASEGVPFIGQCALGSYHVYMESGIFEFLREDGTPARPGETGEITVTSFCQWKTPLIRYRTGDLARVPPAESPPCACGRMLPVVTEILGRVEDVVLTRDGRSIGMFAYRTLKHVPGMKEAQIVQQAPDRFLVRLVPDGSRPVPEVGGDIERIFKSVVGHELTVDLELLSAINRGSNGKFRSVVRVFATTA